MKGSSLQQKLYKYITIKKYIIILLLILFYNMFI